MPSKVDALVRSFLQTDGDALYLVPGERMFLMRGQTRSVVGREPLSPESFLAVADELVPSVEPEVLAQERHKMPFQLDGSPEAVEIRFGLSQGQPAIMVARLRRQAGEPTAPASPPVSGAIAAPAAPPPSPAPARPAARPASPPPPPPPGPAAPPPAEAAAAPPESLSYTPEPEGAPEPTGPPSIVPLPFEPDGTLTRRRGVSVRKLDDVLPAMVEAGASDVLLSAGSVPVFRVHGELVPQDSMVELRSEQIDKLLLPLTPERSRKDLAERNDAVFTCEVRAVGRFRVAAFRDRRGTGAVLHRIPLEVPTVEQLGLPDPVVRLADLHRGLVLVVGPAGSGKTTTLAALVDRINRTRTGHIVSIEDPIELVHENRRCVVNQREALTHTLGVKEGLEAALVAGPDVVVIGELRDVEPVALALQAAEAGRLVLATMSTPSAASTVDRLVDEFPPDRQHRVRAMLADYLKGVVAQTLCRRIGGGRVAAFEILLRSGAVANLIRDGKTFQLPSTLQTSRSQGMASLDDSLLELVKKGIVAPREAVERSTDPARLLAALHAEGSSLPPWTGDDGEAAPGGRAAETRSAG